MLTIASGLKLEFQMFNKKSFSHSVKKPEDTKCATKQTQHKIRKNNHSSSTFIHTYYGNYAVYINISDNRNDGRLSLYDDNFEREYNYSISKTNELEMKPTQERVYIYIDMLLEFMFVAYRRRRFDLSMQCRNKIC